MPSNPVNADVLRAVAEAVEKLNKVDCVDLRGEVAVEYGGDHVGYVTFNGGTEVTFAQVPA